MRPLGLVLNEKWNDLYEKTWVKKYEAPLLSNFKWKAPWVSRSTYLMSCGMGPINRLDWLYQQLTLIGNQTIRRSTIRAENLGAGKYTYLFKKANQK